MINSPLAIFFITVFSTLGFILPYSNKTQDLPQTKQDREEIILNDSFSAQSILVLDIKSGERVVDIDSDDVFGIASLTGLYDPLADMSPSVANTTLTILLGLSTIILYASVHPSIFHQKRNLAHLLRG